MKIGLLTFHGAHNYGAVLQAYATQEKIKEIGFDIEVIDYNPAYLIKQKIFPTSSYNSISVNLKLIIEGIISLPWKLKRRANFQKFINQKLQLSNQKYLQNPFSENTDYDLYIMGSDQIWNCKLTKGFDSVYLGNFKTKPTAKKITYAASMSHYGLSISQKEEFSNLLSNFNAISVREKELEDLLAKEFKVTSTTVVDPTFLLTKDKWKSISIKPDIKKKYILVYAVGLQEETMKLAKKIAKQFDLEVVELTMGVDKKAVVNNYQKASPEEYVGLFEYAAFVITSSFHGTAFSIIFNKPFYSIEQGNDKDSRQKTLLDNLGLTDRFIKHNDLPDYKMIDYNLVNSKIEYLKTESINFLKNNLNKN